MLVFRMPLHEILVVYYAGFKHNNQQPCIMSRYPGRSCSPPGIQQSCPRLSLALWPVQTFLIR